MGIINIVKNTKELYPKCTKLLVPRNGPNVKERIDIENKLNL